MGLVAIVKKAVSGLYTLLAVAFLSCWILVALGLTALSAANRDAAGIASFIAPPTLLVYLASKLVAIVAGATSADAQKASLARWIASADNGSPHGALALFLLGVVWLKALAPWLILLQVLAIFGAAFLFAAYMSASAEQQQQQTQSAWVSDAVACADTPVIPMVDARGVAPCSAMALYSSLAAWSPASAPPPSPGKLAEVFAQIKAETGYDPAAWIERFPPSVVFPLLLAVLAAVATLTLYAALKTLGGLRRVLSASSAEWATRGGGESNGTTPVRVVRLDAALGGGKEDGGDAADAVRSAWSGETPKSVFTGDW
ncbi:hypothetical protein RB595_010345 [Gaeumannomyces hyphopodioides]